jgi:hypothetical protein
MNELPTKFIVKSVDSASTVVQYFAAGDFQMNIAAKFVDDIFQARFFDNLADAENAKLAYMRIDPNFEAGTKTLLLAKVAIREVF